MNTYTGKQRWSAPDAQSSSGRSTAAADLAHVPHQLLDGAVQQPQQLRVVHDPSAQPHEFVDVLVRHGQVEQHLGQLVGVRQHASPPLFGSSW